MTETYLTFQKFNDIELANEIAKRLKLYDIPYLIEDNKKFLESALSNYNEPDISIKLKPEDFSKADRALEFYYEEQLQYVDKDYYLFEFTDEELIEIISKPDEWGHFDYQLAKKILKDRGKEINPAVAELLRTQRNKELAKPIAVHRSWIFTGYFTAIFLSIIGIAIGWTLSYHKKTLPDGHRVFAYTEKDRDHGTRILLIAIISLIVFVVIRWFYLNEY